MSTDRTDTRRLMRRAARLGINVRRETRQEMLEILAGLARDPKTSPRERRSAAAALISAHKSEMEALKIQMEVQSFAALSAELAEIRELLHENGGDRPGAGPDQDDATGQEPA